MPCRAWGAGAGDRGQDTKEARWKWKVRNVGDTGNWSRGLFLRMRECIAAVGDGKDPLRGVRPDRQKE